jgi:hypothetical protein
LVQFLNLFKHLFYLQKTQDENVKNAITFEIWLHNGLEIAPLGGQRKLFCGLYPELYS